MFHAEFDSPDFEKKREKEIPYKTFDYNTNTSRAHFLFSDNYIYMLSSYIPSGWMTPTKNFRADKYIYPDLIFAHYLVQIGYDGTVKEAILPKELEDMYADSYVNGGVLIICLSKQNEKTFENHYYFTNIDPQTLKASRVTNINQPAKIDGWNMSLFRDSIAYFAGVDTKGYTGRNKLPSLTTDGTLYGILHNGKIKK